MSELRQVPEIHWQPKQPHRFLDFLAAGSSGQLAGSTDRAQAAVLRACIRFGQRNAVSEKLQEAIIIRLPASSCIHLHAHARRHAMVVNPERAEICLTHTN